MNQIHSFFAMLLLIGAVACGSSQQNSISENAQTPADTAATQADTGQPAENLLTGQEQKDGWKLLFDGKTTAGWRGAYLDKFPEKGWTVENGTLTVQEAGGAESQHGGDIVTVDEYSAFDLKFEFKLSDSANSGVKYFVVEHQPKPKGSAFGLEFQVLDDAKHPDAKLGRGGNRTVGSLYDLIAAKDKSVNPIGEWNEGRVLVQGSHVEHWLNGKKVVGYERGGTDFRKFVSMSKYAAPDYNAHGRFGEAAKGHILLQDHGDRVWFRNVKIKTL